MTFLEKLLSHRGGLIRLKTGLYWYDGRGWDGSPGRVCLLLDFTPTIAIPAVPTAWVTNSLVGVEPDAAVHLLIDGQNHWVWVMEKDMELLK